MEVKTTTGVERVLHGRKPLIQKVVLARTKLAQLAVGFFNLQVSVDGDQATVELEGRAMGRLPGREDYFLEQHKGVVTLSKIEGEWLIQHAHNIEPIDWIVAH